MKKKENGSPVSPACKHGNGESATMISVGPNNGSVGLYVDGLFARAIANHEHGLPGREPA